MQRAFRLARKVGAQVFHVTPEPSAVPFYRRVGLEPVDELLWSTYTLPRRARRVRVAGCDEEPYQAVSGLVHVFGRYISSRHTWRMTSRWYRPAGDPAPLPRRFRLSVGGRPARLALRYGKRGRRWGYGWLSPGVSPAMLFDRLARLAVGEGGRTLSTLMSRTVHERLARRFRLVPGGPEVLLARSL